MSRHRQLTENPNAGSEAMLAGTRDVLGDKYRTIIEANYRYVQQASAAVITVGAGFMREETAWHLKAACQGAAQPDTFFPVTDEQKRDQAWLPYCEACPVFQECTDFRAKYHEEGVWGGVFYPGKSYSARPRGRPRKSDRAEPSEVVSVAVVTS